MATKKEKEDLTKTEKTAEPTYLKRQLTGFVKYRGRTDLLMTLLEDNKYYTLAEVDRIIEKFLKN